MSDEKKKILIVDDNEDFLEVFEESLMELGPFDILKLSDSFTAYEITRAQKFDMIFVDYKMPRLTGSQLIVALRKASFNEFTPVILVTAFPEEVSFEEKVDGVFYLTKPVSEVSLKKALANARYKETI